MKVSYPLSLKVSLWLFVNLLLLTAAGLAFYASHFGLGWDSLTRGALGERLQGIGDSIASDFSLEPPSAWPAMLDSRKQQYGADFFLFTNSGTQVAGDAVDLPAAMREELMREARRGGPAAHGVNLPPPPAGPLRNDGPTRDRPLLDERPAPEDRRPADARPRRAGRPPGEGRFVIHTTEPATTWIGLRVPIPNKTGQPIAGAVIIRATSLVAIGRLLHAGAWLAVAASAFGLSVLFWLPLVGSITRAIRRLTRATERIAEGNFETRVALLRRDEIGHLSQSVDRMAARLDTLVNDQKRFLGDVAHELGSPIGRLQVATEILETRADPALREAIGDVREEVQQMAALVNELLAFTRAGLRARDVAPDSVSLAPLAARVIARDDRTGRVRIEIADDLTALADAALLERALSNLVRNALRYAPEDGAITLSARHEIDEVVLCVTDHGPGVPPTALPRLGEPFYRPEAARGRESGGVGLGLSIVKTSIAACQGSVTFRNLTPHGFTAEIRLARGAK